MAQGVWLTNSLGGYLYSPKMSKQMREQASPLYVFRQFVSIKEDFGKNQGDTVEFDKQLLIDTRGSTLTETATMPKNTIKFMKGSVVVDEMGNGVSYTNKLENLSEFNMKDRYAKGLISDQKDSLDRAAATQFQLAKFKAVCTNTATTIFTTDGTATITSTASPSDKNVRDVVDYLMQHKVPKYGGGDYYMGMLSVKAMRGVYDYLQAVAQYAEPEFRFKNEAGQYYSARHVAENNVLSNTLGGSTYGEGVYFGDEAVIECVALPEELRYESTDVGRSKTLAWLAILEFKKMWDLGTDDLNSTGNGIERIVHITSA